MAGMGGMHPIGGMGGPGGMAGMGGMGGGPGSGGRGAYLVNAVLGCVGCHSPMSGPPLSGRDCFRAMPGCLSSANLTNDDTGLKKLTDQQIKDAIRKGMDPEGAGKYLFAVMPYYQFANLSDADADAIVAYLRSVPGVVHTVQANTTPYDVQPTAPEWLPVTPSELPASSTAVGPANGKYLATLACVTCHTVEATVMMGMPRHIDATKAFQGGLVIPNVMLPAGGTKTIQSANLTPDATGLMSWNVSQIATAITSGKDKNGNTLCGMRALGMLTPSDATDIGSYLLSIPPVANTITMTCQ